MMKGENIVCFAKDWSEDPTSNNHVMRLLARDNRVLWLNSIATRAPDLRSASDLGKIGRKLRAFSRGPQQVAENLWVYTPIVLPFPHSAAAVAANGHVLRATVALLRRRLGMREFQLWTFLPTSVRYVGTLGEALSVYYCTDEWSQFSSVDSARITAMERELCGKVDLVFATARSLQERRRAYNAETHLASHGVDHAHFARALEPATTIPDDVARLPRPLVGFFGLLQDWIDLELLARVAERHPEWSVVLIGKAQVDVARLARLPNVHLLGRRPYEELPRYCKAFQAGLIPFAINELTHHVNPIKLREYLSAGLPVVSTALPEVASYGGLCTVAADADAFVAGLEAELAADDPARRRARSEAMRRETWEQKVADLGDEVLRAKARRAAR